MLFFLEWRAESLRCNLLRLHWHYEVSSSSPSSFPSLWTGGGFLLEEVSWSIAGGRREVNSQWSIAYFYKVWFYFTYVHMFDWLFLLCLMFCWLESTNQNVWSYHNILCLILFQIRINLLIYYYYLFDSVCQNEVPIKWLNNNFVNTTTFNAGRLHGDDIQLPQ